MYRQLTRAVLAQYRSSVRPAPVLCWRSTSSNLTAPEQRPIDRLIGRVRRSAVEPARPKWVRADAAPDLARSFPFLMRHLPSPRARRVRWRARRFAKSGAPLHGREQVQVQRERVPPAPSAAAPHQQSAPHARCACARRRLLHAPSTLGARPIGPPASLERGASCFAAPGPCSSGPSSVRLLRSHFGCSYGAPFARLAK